LDSKFVTTIFKLSDKANKKWEKFENTKPGKVFTIGTGVAVSRVTSIVLASLTIAGLASPASPAIATAIGVIGLTTVAIGVVMDTVRTRATRQLQKENQLLVKNRTAKSIEDQIFKLDPSLNEILKGELYEPITTGKKSVEKRYTTQSSAKVEVAKDIGKAFFKQGLSIVSTVLEAIATRGVNIVKAIGSFILSLATESRHNMSIRTVQKQLKTQIDQERDKSKKTKFQEYKEQVSQTEKAIGVYNNIFARGLKKLTSLIKDVGRAHDPFSEFNYPDKIRIDKHSNITATIDKHSKKENLAMSVSSIRENLSHNTPHPSKTTPEQTRHTRKSSSQKERDQYL